MVPCLGTGEGREVKEGGTERQAGYGLLQRQGVFLAAGIPVARKAIGFFRKIRKFGPASRDT